MSVEILKSRFLGSADLIKYPRYSSDKPSNGWYLIDSVSHLIKCESEIKYLINEMLGEDLYKYIGLKTVQYFIARLSSDLLREQICAEVNNERYVIISRNFKEKNKIYYTGKDILSLSPDLLRHKREESSYLIKLGCFRNFCLDDNNYKNFKETMFKRLITNFFMGQLDGHYNLNIMFEKDLNGIFDLSHSFDFGCSFDVDYVKSNEEYDFLGNILFPSDELREFIYDSPNNIEIMKKIINLNANEFFEKFQNERGILFSKKEYSEKIKFCKTRQAILQRCLRSK